MCNYTQEIINYVNGQTSISNIARSLIENGATEKELGSFEADLQQLYDDGIIDSKKVVSINAGLQRETKRYSKEIAKGTEFEGQVINIGCKVKDDNVTVGRVENSRNRSANKPKDNDKTPAKTETLEGHLEAIAALCDGLVDDQKKDIVKMLANKLGMKASVSIKK